MINENYGKSQLLHVIECKTLKSIYPICLDFYNVRKNNHALLKLIKQNKLSYPLLQLNR